MYGGYTIFSTFQRSDIFNMLVIKVIKRNDCFFKNKFWEEESRWQNRRMWLSPPPTKKNSDDKTKPVCETCLHWPGPWLAPRAVAVRWPMGTGRFRQQEPGLPSPLTALHAPASDLAVLTTLPTSGPGLGLYSIGTWLYCFF